VCLLFFNLSFLGTLPSGPHLLLRVDPKRRKAKLKLEIGKKNMFVSSYTIPEVLLLCSVYSDGKAVFFNVVFNTVLLPLLYLRKYRFKKNFLTGIDKN
jgi:hypothetical protein